jgi:sugar phosphate isomerase/epimerase
MSDAADPERKKQLLNDYIEIMADLSRYAKEQGLSYLLVEPMSIPREYPCTIEETKDIFQRLEQAMALPVYLNLDVGHLNIISANPDDANPLAWIRELGQYCKVLHIQQTDAKTGSHHWPFTEEYNAKGAINTGEVIKAVKAHGVDMYLIFELFYKPFGDNDDKVLTTLKESVIHWKKALAEV